MTNFDAIAMANGRIMSKRSSRGREEHMRPVRPFMRTPSGP